MRMADIDDIWEADSLFVDRDVLTAEYNPTDLSEIMHRTEIIREFALHLRPLKNNQIPTNLLMYGHSGTGKTLVTQVLLDDVIARTNHKVKWIHIYCENNQTDTKILSALNEALEYETNTPHAKLVTDVGVYFDWFCKLVNIYDGIIIIFLDEVDKMRNPDLINRFNRAVENKAVKRKICLISAVNDMTFRDNLDNKTKDALAANEISYSPYDADVLVDILQDRAKKAFREDVLDEMVIPRCAAFAASENGSARYALDLLRQAGDTAEKNGREIVYEEDVVYGKKALESKKYEDSVKTLPMHEQIVLLAALLAKHELESYRITTGLVYEIYCCMCKEYGTETVSQRRVTDLISSLSSQGLLRTNVVNKGRKGRTKEIIGTMDINHIHVLNEDSLFSRLLDFKNIVKRYNLNDDKQTSFHPDFKFAMKGE